jgi:hypothetical protein
MNVTKWQGISEEIETFSLFPLPTNIFGAQAVACVIFIEVLLHVFEKARLYLTGRCPQGKGNFGRQQKENILRGAFLHVYSKCSMYIQ